jgi:hypothetical protein
MGGASSSTDPHPPSSYNALRQQTEQTENTFHPLAHGVYQKTPRGTAKAAGVTKPVPKPKAAPKAKAAPKGKAVQVLLADLTPAEKELMSKPRGMTRSKTRAQTQDVVRPTPRKRQGGPLVEPDPKKVKLTIGKRKRPDDKDDKTPRKRRKGE